MHLPLLDDGLRSNHSAAGARDTCEGVSGPGSHNPWPLLVDAQAAGPIWIGNSERRAVHVPRGHVGDTAMSKAATTPARNTLGEG